MHNKYSSTAFLLATLCCSPFILANVLSEAGESTEVSYTCPESAIINDDFFKFDKNELQTSWYIVPMLNKASDLKFTRVYLDYSTFCAYSRSPCYYVSCLYSNEDRGFTAYVANYSNAVNAKAPLGENWTNFSDNKLTCESHEADDWSVDGVLYNSPDNVPKYLEFNLPLMLPQQHRLIISLTHPVESCLIYQQEYQYLQH